MKVREIRWGEITIKKQKGKKNEFDKTKSFSIDPLGHNYTLEEYFEILRMVTDLTEKCSYQELKKKLESLKS
jgi:hypothetical protein